MGTLGVSLFFCFLVVCFAVVWGLFVLSRQGFSRQLSLAVLNSPCGPGRPQRDPLTFAGIKGACHHTWQECCLNRWWLVKSGKPKRKPHSFAVG